ncbi:MAG: GNAT family N-acetyltransferase [Candidatus Ozemobacteraceae bacterium]
MKQREIALLYAGTSLPILLCLTEQIEAARDLLRSVTHLLPPRFYAHLTEKLDDAFQESHRLENHGTYLKMALGRTDILQGISTENVTRFSPVDWTEIKQFYDRCHPQNWFDSRMLETGFYFGRRMDSQITSAGGIHVVSSEFKVAALGNIVTDMQFRGRGQAKSVCAALCLALLKEVDQIGLNVSADNATAIQLYKSLGFVEIGTYVEWMVTKP